jgi:phosphoglucosamine mutase
VSRRLFGTSGIRGVVNEDLTPDFCHQVAQALGSTLPPASRVCLATDTRVSREIIKAAVVSGLLSSGIDVTDLGILPTPALALLTRELGFDTGIMITASHNPPQFNGIKLFNGNSLGYSPAQEAEVERIYFDKGFRAVGQGTLEKSQDAKQRYFSFIKDRLYILKPAHRLRLVIDPGNGAAAGFITDLFGELGFDVIPLNDKPDGLFPGRSPEPKEDTLTGTIDFLKKQNADLAICFDGDADRVVFCDGEGFLGFNEMIAFISRQVINKTGKKIIATTVETGILLDLAVKDLGGEVVRGKVGDINVAYLARELDAALGVEAVGVYIIPEVGFYPDSIFATLTLLSSIKDAGEIRRFFQAMPRLFFSKSQVACPNQAKEPVMARVKQKVHIFAASHVNDLDGLRFEFADSWMLIRASGTEPVIRVIAESTSSPKTKSLLKQGTDVVQELVKEAGQ